MCTRCRCCIECRPPCYFKACCLLRGYFVLAASRRHRCAQAARAWSRCELHGCTLFWCERNSVIVDAPTAHLLNNLTHIYMVCRLVGDEVLSIPVGGPVNGARGVPMTSREGDIGGQRCILHTGTPCTVHVVHRLGSALRREPTFVNNSTSTRPWSVAALCLSASAPGLPETARTYINIELRVVYPETSGTGSWSRHCKRVFVAARRFAAHQPCRHG